MTSRLALQGVGDIKRDEAKIRAFGSTMDSMAMSKKGRKVMRDDKLCLRLINTYLHKTPPPKCSN